MSAFPNCKYFLYFQLTLATQYGFLIHRYLQAWGEWSSDSSGRLRQESCLPFLVFWSLLCWNYPWTTAMENSWTSLKNKFTWVHHSPQLPPTDLAAETWAVNTGFVSDHTLHGVDRLQAWGTHFFQHGLKKKERLKLNNSRPWPYICI